MRSPFCRLRNSDDDASPEKEDGVYEFMALSLQFANVGTADIEMHSRTLEVIFASCMSAQVCPGKKRESAAAAAAVWHSAVDSTTHREKKYGKWHLSKSRRAVAQRNQRIQS